MINDLKNNFFQAAFGSTLWVALLATLFNYQNNVEFMNIWNLLGIGGLLGLVFGVIYPYLWNYSTFKASINILLCTVLNLLCGYLCLYLFSNEMFNMVKPYFIGVFLLTLVGHILGFYFYKRYENNKLVNSLNNKLKKAS
ncbi:hypothetical protein [Lysinibacillus agricola]|uniref:hypothetical protein n=1 Tax=Lysinibacillus agricola TaxID=2590012 RepID=UPI003C1A1973